MGSTSELVYKILKATYDHIDEIHAVAPTWKGVQLKDALHMAQIPVHPGAMKFYEEHGVKKELEFCLTQPD